MAELNPLRYRGYYYDTETRFYYLQSRYYDPANHRFINADSQINLDGFIDYNMFAYCCNNPVASSDHDGRDQEYELASKEETIYIGNIRIVVTTTFYLTVPDGMPYTIALSNSEFSFGAAISNFDFAFGKEYSEETGDYTVALTLYDDGENSRLTWSRQPQKYNLWLCIRRIGNGTVI
ncbi:MAG: RHS repeat-associated core domain-containing protein [Oscillospiraceae bacterium]|nr:RHS repeat-associated core domain-containing protein [Oscillospiraceae bacterium]